MSVKWDSDIIYFRVILGNEGILSLVYNLKICLDSRNYLKSAKMKMSNLNSRAVCTCEWVGADEARKSEVSVPTGFSALEEARPLQSPVSTF